jgi:pyruvate,water dikinase
MERPDRSVGVSLRLGGCPMSWLGRMLRPAGGSEDLVLLKLRAARFRQLIRSYGAFLALLEDSAEKQGGSFILDRHYVVTLAEQVAEIADGVAFDLNVLTSNGNLAFYERSDRLRSDLRGLLAEGAAGAETSPRGEAVPAVSPAALAEALSRARVLFRERGQVACTGVAAGPVWIPGDGATPEGVPAGSVLVAGDPPSGSEALEAMGGAAALLLDRGSVSSPAARRAREVRIPAIVGLGDATRLLAGGGEVTVDADENVVYEGRVGELLAYDRSTHPVSGEEPEYALLRALRRAVFSLTLPSDRPEAAAADCRTFHDLLHLAQSLAGDAVAALLASRCRDAGTELRLAGAPSGKAYVVRLDCVPDPEAKGDASPVRPSSRPLEALLEGLGSFGLSAGDGSGRSPSTVGAVATDEHALAAMSLPDGFDLLDATASAAARLNSVYCRFSPRGNADPAGTRGALAAEALGQLGFSVARTGRDVTGWLCGLQAEDVEDRVRAVGRLRVRLGTRSAGDPERGVRPGPGA